MTTSSAGRAFQPAWLLHSRPFRDTSLLLDFLTRDSGRISALARGARKAGKGGKSGLLQPFTPLQVALAGRHDLKTLSAVDALGPALVLRGERLFSGLYLNELLVRLLQGHDADAELYAAYEDSLQALWQGAEEVEPVLRRFELRLLEALGYGVDFTQDAESGEALRADGWYYFHPESGFTAVADPGAAPGLHYCEGALLLRIAAQDFSDAAVRRLAKRLLRSMLRQLLGERPLQSRLLFSGRGVEEG